MTGIECARDCIAGGRDYCSGGLCEICLGSLWAQLYGTDGLGSLQSIGSAGQIAGAAAGPPPGALALAYRQLRARAGQ